MRFRLVTAIAALAFAAGEAAAGPVHVYGPGGPAPAMKEAAANFGAKNGVKVEVIAGPTKDWLGRTKGDADVIYSGSETMMSDFMVALDGQIGPSSVEPLYLGRSAILVRKGNPKRIKGLQDLMKPGHRVLVVNGAGQNGLWEDMAGRMGDIASVRGLRRSIAAYSATSADAKAAWIAIKASTPGSSGTSGRSPTRSSPTWSRWSRSIGSIANPASP